MKTDSYLFCFKAPQTQVGSKTVRPRDSASVPPWLGTGRGKAVSSGEKCPVVAVSAEKGVKKPTNQRRIMHGRGCNSEALSGSFLRKRL